jgi:hypothetical protein
VERDTLVDRTVWIIVGISIVMIFVLALYGGKRR